MQCTTVEDEHYEALQQMEEQIKTFRTSKGSPYRLFALPMADKIEEGGERLPATYANFLIMNEWWCFILRTISRRMMLVPRGATASFSET